jgi:type VI secretion system protein VasD
VNKTRSPASSAPTANGAGALRQHVRRTLCATLAFGIVAWGAGCSLMAPKPPPPPPPPPPPKPPPPPPKLSISVVAARRLNPDIRGRASPVVVRLYELKSVAPFDSADFMSLYEKDRSVLGSELVAREEFMLEPGESKAIDKLLAPEVRCLGVVVTFREIERAQWRGVVNLVPGKDNAVVIKLEDVLVRAGMAGR